MLSSNAQCTCCYEIGTETVCNLPALFLFQGFYLYFCSLVRLVCINRDKWWHLLCFEIVLCNLYDQHTTVLAVWQDFRMHPHLNYQPCNFTVFLTVPPSSKHVQISKVHLWIIKKYAWLGLLIQSKYRSWLSYSKAVIPYFLAIVWVITWATTAVLQGFAGRWEFPGFCGEPGDCQLCCVLQQHWANICYCCRKALSGCSLGAGCLDEGASGVFKAANTKILSWRFKTEWKNWN